MPRQRTYTVLLISFLTSCISGREVITPPSAIPANTGIISSPTSMTELSILQPDWFKDPKSNILMLTDLRSAVFIDPVTLDDVWLVFDDARWVNSNYVGFSPYPESRCSTGRAYRYLFNLSMWKIENFSLNPNDLLKFCFYVSHEDVTKNQDNSLMFYDIHVGAWVKFLDVAPDQIVYDFKKIGEKAYVLLGASEGEAKVITVYDIDSMKALKSYTGEVADNIIKYSAKLQKIAYVSNNNICFVGLESLERECKVDFSDVYENVRLGDFLSSGDLPFSYDTSPHVNYNIRKICVFLPATGGIECPTENLEILNPKVEYKNLSPDSNEKYEINKTWSVLDAKISPDETWLAFCYGLDFPGGYEGLAFVDMNGQNFKAFDNPFLKSFPPLCDEYRLVYSEYSWRPLP